MKNLSQQNCHQTPAKTEEFPATERHPEETPTADEETMGQNDDYMASESEESEEDDDRVHPQWATDIPHKHKNKNKAQPVKRSQQTSSLQEPPLALDMPLAFKEATHKHYQEPSLKSKWEYPFTPTHECHLQKHQQSPKI